MKPDPNQFESTWLFPHVKEVVRPDEVARVLSISARHVADLCDSGHFLCAVINDAPESKRILKHRRILRFSVEAWWLNQLEETGVKLPITETPQVTHWRAELKKLPK